MAKKEGEIKNNLATNGVYVLMDDINMETCRECIKWIMNCNLATTRLPKFSLPDSQKLYKFFAISTFFQKPKENTSNHTTLRVEEWIIVLLGATYDSNYIYTVQLTHYKVKDVW